MADLAVTERRIRPIQDAAAAKNWKQALQLCEKWQKKGENSDRFLALRASVLINQPDNAQIEKGKQEALKLCSRKNPVTDIEALHQLQGSLKHLSLQNEEGTRLWERAASAVPGDKGLMTTWLNGALVDSNWLMAQKAAMALRKSFPKERQYEFWNILFCYLAHQDVSLAAKEKALFGMLAYRLISKAAEAIPKDTSEILSPGNAIATTEELALLLQIYCSTSHVEEAIALLRSQAAGLTSKIAEQDVTMVLLLLLQALSKSESSSSVLEICQNLLEDQNSPVKDLVEDDRIWRVIVAAGTATTASDRAKSLSIVTSVLDKHPMCRAAHLAKLDLVQSDTGEQNYESTQLLKACQTFLENFKTKPFCFDDLCASLQQLRTDDVQQLIHTISSNNNTSAEKLLILKMNYTLLGRTETRNTDTFNFASQAIRLVKSLPEAGNERPEAALLAALALLRLAANLDSIELVLQASAIMESMYSKYGDYYPLAVRLLQAYRCIGLMSLATSKFIALSIKNMQWDTVSHLLLTRASTLHPIPSGHDENSLNPLSALDTALEMFDNLEQSLNNAIQKGLNFGSYANVLDTVDVRSKMQRNLNRQLFTIEERRIQNMVGVPVDTVLQPFRGPLEDTRDFSFLNKYGTSDEVLENYLACGVLPGQTWLEVMSFSDHLYQYLKFESAGLSTQATNMLAELNQTFAAINAWSEKPSDNLTSAESRSLEIRLLVYQLVLSLQTPGSTQSQIDSEADKLSSLLKAFALPNTQSVGGIQVPTSHYLHTLFSEMEVLQTVNLFTEFLSKKAKLSKGKVPVVSQEKITQLRNTITEAVEAVRNSARHLKDGINSSGVLGQFIESAAGRSESGQFSQLSEYKALGEECDSLFDEVFLEERCGGMKESWDDALNGLLAVKIKISR